jgi:aliphatic nitrilase
LSEAEGLLYQEIDIAQCVEPKQFHDVVGYYNRFDVFELNVTRKRLTPIVFSDESDESLLPALSTGPTAN